MNNVINELKTIERRVLVYDNQDDFIYFIIENGRISHFYVEKNAIPRIGDIFVARIQNVSTQIGAYFVLLDDNTRAYLSFENVITGNTYHQGDLVTVMVQKEAYMNKLATVTEKLELCTDNYVLSLSSEKRKSFSKKLSDEEKLSIKNNSLYKSACKSDNSYSILFRTNFINSIEDNFGKLAYSVKQLDEIVSKGTSSFVVKCLKKGNDFLINMINDGFLERTDKIICNNENSKKYVDELDHFTDVNVYSDDKISMSALYGLRTKLDLITDKKILLKSGGSIVIEQTEALCSIDVNMGKMTNTNHRAKAILKTNLEAAREISYQIGARNISGIIIIDFINMNTQEDVTILIEELKCEFKTLKPTPRLEGVTKLGLFEISRAKRACSIYENASLLNETILRF